MHKQQDNHTPIVMCFSGHDPSGGAGIQADIEAINANQSRVCSVITALTVQDSRDVKHVAPVALTFFKDAAHAILNDIAVTVFKTGLLADTPIALAMANVARQHPHIPLVVDPVLASGSGSSLASNDLIQALRDVLLPLATIVTPNLPEAQTLSGKQTPDACAEKILRMGCKYVLLTGTHAKSEQVINSLYSKNKKTDFSVERLAGEFHGSGCTLASSLAANLANKQCMQTAVSNALDYTWQTLKHANAIGKGQLHPHRLYAYD